MRFSSPKIKDTTITIIMRVSESFALNSSFDVKTLNNTMPRTAAIMVLIFDGVFLSSVMANLPYFYSSFCAHAQCLLTELHKGDGKKVGLGIQA